MTLTKNKRKKPITGQAAKEHIEMEVMNQTMENMDVLFNPKYAGLIDLYRNPVEKYIQPEGFGTNEIHSLDETNYLNGLISRFEQIGEVFLEDKALVLVDKFTKAREGYNAQTFDKVIPLLPGKDLKNIIARFFDSSHFKCYTIIQDDRAKIEDAFFDANSTYKFQSWLEDDVYTATPDQVLTTKHINLSKDDQNVLEFIALKKLLNIQEDGFFFYFGDNISSQQEQKEELIQKISRSYQGEIEQIYNAKLKLDEHNSLSAEFLFRQAKHIHNINTVFAAVDNIVKPYREAKEEAFYKSQHKPRGDITIL